MFPLFAFARQLAFPSLSADNATFLEVGCFRVPSSSYGSHRATFQSGPVRKDVILAFDAQPWTRRAQEASPSQPTWRRAPGLRLLANLIPSQGRRVGSPTSRVKTPRGAYGWINRNSILSLEIPLSLCYTVLQAYQALVINPSGTFQSRFRTHGC